MSQTVPTAPPPPTGSPTPLDATYRRITWRLLPFLMFLNQHRDHFLNVVEALGSREVGKIQRIGPIAGSEKISFFACNGLSPRVRSYQNRTAILMAYLQLHIVFGTNAGKIGKVIRFGGEVDKYSFRQGSALDAEPVITSRLEKNNGG